MKRLTGIVFVLAFAAIAAAEVRFYPDDPLRESPKPRDAGQVRKRKLSDYYDFFANIFKPAGEHHTRRRIIPSQAVNTLGEPIDRAWYTPRHYDRPMTVEELVAGPGNRTPPAPDGPWTIVAAKSEGITPGFMIRDSRGQTYLLKFDPLHYPELATGADVISSKFFHALGYHVPENYPVYFNEEQLQLGDDVRMRNAFGQPRKMTTRDLIELLVNVPRDKDRRYRGLASRLLPGAPLGPFRYWGARSDDPNDIVPHEHRRDLRGLSVFCAWLDHDDSRSINTLDMLVEEGGVKFVRHHLVDFGSTLGSASNGPNSPRSGGEYLFSAREAFKQFITFGLWVPHWARARYPDIPALGRFESKVFDPVTWVPEYPNPAFTNRLPDDSFWAAKQVMAFTDEQVRAIVRTAEYSDPAAEKYIADALIERRDKIGRAFFRQVLPLDQFAIQNGELKFVDLEIKHGFAASREYKAEWSTFDNASDRKTPIAGATTFRVPPVAEGGYLAVDIHSANAAHGVTVYLRNRHGAMQVVGIDRSW
ncbi:MAG: hypothetical protein KIT09_13985 [Bryobacteraceae bacterium]|nr:hypothetical protein [Bryobacteraceae bacterium]